MIEWRVTIGELIGASALLVSVITGVWALGRKFTSIETALAEIKTQLEPIWKWWNDYSPQLVKPIHTKSDGEIIHDIKNLQAALEARRLLERLEKGEGNAT